MTKQEAHFEPSHKKGDEVMEITLIAKCDRCKEAKDNEAAFYKGEEPCKQSSKTK